MDLPFRPTRGTPMDMTITKMGPAHGPDGMGAHVALPGFKRGAPPPLAKEFASPLLSFSICKPGIIAVKGEGASVNVNIHRHTRAEQAGTEGAPLKVKSQNPHHSPAIASPQQVAPSHPSRRVGPASQGSTHPTARTLRC